MPDFNKGDFTQQGVAGHVNANLRLNEKRLVNIDLTSNEEAEGCTITGTVKDLLNDKVYPIGSGVSGNIEITENGENINVAPYATATVNVSGGGGVDLAFCDIKVVNNCGTTNGVGSDQAGYVITDSVLDLAFIELEDNTTGNIRVYYSISNTKPAIILRGLVETEPAYILTGSENVGCTYMNNPSNTNFIVIILNNDETESSITITITSESGN